MKIIKNLVLCLVLLFTISFFNDSVLASEVNSNYILPDVGVIQENGEVLDLEGNKIGNVPIGYLKSAKASDGKYATGYDIGDYSSTRYGQILMLIYGGKWYVCIEPTADTNGNGAPGSTTIWNSLSNVEKNKIGLAVSYAGSKIGSISPTDINDKQWVAASQLYVWNVIDDEKYSDSAIANDGGMGSKFSEIKEYVRYSTTKPSFSGTGKSAVWDSPQNRYEVVFTDTNNVIGKQNKITPYPTKVGDWNLSISDGAGSDTMTLWSTSKYPNGYAFTPSNYNYKPIGEGASNSGSRYVNFGDQSAMLGSNLVSLSDDPLRISFNVNMPSSSYQFGKAELWKENQNKLRLKGVQFKIYTSGGTYKQTITTDSNGHAVTIELPKGKYYAVESSAGNNEGITLPGTKFWFEIPGQLSASDNPVNIYSGDRGIIINTQKGRGQLTKTDEKGVKLVGVQFKVYTSGGTYKETITTNSTGVATTSYLSTGSYYAIESSVGGNQVVLDSTTKQNFTISGGTTSNPNNNPINIGTIVNKNKGCATLTKTNQNGAPLNGIVFKIYNTSNVVVDTITTNSSGVATTKYLPQGSYYAMETSVGNYTDITFDPIVKYSFRITGSTTPDKISMDNIINQQYGLIEVTEISSAMLEENVVIKLKHSGNWVGAKPQVRAVVKNNNVVVYDQNITMSQNKEQTFTVKIPITSGNNTIKVELSNIGGAKYTLKNLDNVRYAPSGGSKSISVDSASQEIKTPVGQKSVQSGDSNYYETITIDGFDTTYDVLDGRIVFDYNLKYEQDVMPYITNSMTQAEFDSKVNGIMYQPLYDSTFMFDQVNGKYELPMKDVAGKLVFKELAYENINGRIYDTTSELYNNPTDIQKDLVDGYRDITDTTTSMSNIYVLPIDDNKVLGTTQDYKVKVTGLGLNNVSFETNQKYTYNKKFASTFADYGKVQVVSSYPTDAEIENIDNLLLMSEYEINGKKFNSTKTWLIEDEIYDQVFNATDLKEIANGSITKVR